MSQDEYYQHMSISWSIFISTIVNTAEILFEYKVGILVLLIINGTNPWVSVQILDRVPGLRMHSYITSRI